MLEKTPDDCGTQALVKKEIRKYLRPAMEMSTYYPQDDLLEAVTMKVTKRRLEDADVPGQQYHYQVKKEVRHILHVKQYTSLPFLSPKHAVAQIEPFVNMVGNCLLHKHLAQVTQVCAAVIMSRKVWSHWHQQCGL